MLLRFSLLLARALSVSPPPWQSWWAPVAGARAGILIRNAEALEVFGKVDTLIIDKTGTLTEGKPTLTSVIPQSGIEESGLLQFVASLERSSEHPLATAIVKGAEAKKLVLVDVVGFSSTTGKGVKGIVSGKQVAVGMQSYSAICPSILPHYSIALKDCAKKAKR